MNEWMNEWMNWRMNHEMQPMIGNKSIYFFSFFFFFCMNQVSPFQSFFLRCVLASLKEVMSVRRLDCASCSKLFHTKTSTNELTHLFFHLIIYSIIDSFNHLFIHSFILSFIHSVIHSFKNYIYT